MVKRNVPMLHTSRIEALEAQVLEPKAAQRARGDLPHDKFTAAVTTADAVDLATSIALANALRAAWNAHVVDLDAHLVSDVANATAAAVATDLATTQTLINDIKAKFNLHVVVVAAHGDLGGAGGDAATATVAVANASDQTTANALCIAMKQAMNRHMGSGVADYTLVAS